MKEIPTINQIIKDKRKEKKITQSTFSEFLNKSTGTIKRYDTGDIIPENVLIKCCEFLELNLFFLLEMQIKQNEEIMKMDNTKKGFYSDLIEKYNKELKEYQNVVYKTDEQLKYYGNQLLKLYELFYNEYYNHKGTIHLTGEKKVLKYKIVNKTIIIICEISKAFFKDANIKVEEINSFSLYEAKEFIKEIENYFNFKNDMFKRKKESEFSIGKFFLKSEK